MLNILLAHPRNFHESKLRGTIEIPIVGALLSGMGEEGPQPEISGMMQMDHGFHAYILGLQIIACLFHEKKYTKRVSDVELVGCASESR
jgi:hypothetical protein